MAKLGFSNTAIGRALNTSEKTIRSYRGGSDDVKSKKSDGNLEKNKQRGPGTNDKFKDKKARKFSNDLDGDPSKTESEGSAGDPGSERINFVGGKKDMGKKDEDTSEESEEYECAECGAGFSGKKDVCPSCGADLDPEAYDE